MRYLLIRRYAYYLHRHRKRTPKTWDGSLVAIARNKGRPTKKQNRITTLTAAGVEFYAKCGFDIVGCNEKGEYKMELSI